MAEKVSSPARQQQALAAAEAIIKMAKGHRLDGLSIPATSTHKAAAAAFINWMIDPAFYVKWDAEGAPATSNTVAAAALPDSSFNRKILGDPAVVAKVEFMKPVSDDTRAKYVALWEALKAAQ